MECNDAAPHHRYRLLDEHNISFIKWAMNRNVSEPGWPDAPGDAREIWVRYLQGLYRLSRSVFHSFTSGLRIEM